MQISVSEFDVSLNLVLSFNEARNCLCCFRPDWIIFKTTKNHHHLKWLITGGLVDRTIAIITQHDEGLTERKQSEIAQKVLMLEISAVL